MDDEYEPAVDPDQARSPKRIRLEAPLAVTEDTQQEMDEDDWDDVYGDAAERAGMARKEDEQNGAPTTLEGPTSTAPSAPHEHQFGVTTKSDAGQEMRDGVPVEDIADDDALVAPGPPPAPENNDHASMDVMQETTEIEYEPPPAETQGQEHSTAQGEQKENGVPPQTATTEPKDLEMGDAETSQRRPKPTEDVEFMRAAAAQKVNTNAEWQYDSSDAESSSDSDSSDSSDDSSDESESGSEGGYEMLDPATAARILMSGDGDDDEGGKGKDKADHQPRTANEVKEELVAKLDVQVTPEMKITHLGNVESIVENMILIKGATPGEYQVLEGGSVLCNEQREVIGAVSDTFGRVQEPLYSVAFNNKEEIEQAGLNFGAKVFYVNDHSTFVFTQPLKNMKGTDASNIHDEEVGEDEMEFSDDEVEADYKRQRKLAKKTGRGGLSRSAFQSGARAFDNQVNDGNGSFIHANASDVPAQNYGGGLSYDDDEPAQDFYQPLKRPENLSELMNNGAPPPRPPQQSFDRGRGRGRGDRGRGRGDRGRGDRGRGRGGFDNRNQRGGRGGFQPHQQQSNSSRGGNNQRGNPHRGNAHSFPDRHNGGADAGQQHALPPKPTVAAAPPPPPAPAQTPAQSYYQQQQPAPQTYQFNGYTFQYGNQAPQQAPAPQYNGYYGQQQQPAGSVPAGAHVNPAFWQQQTQQQQQQQQHQQQQQAYGAWNAQYQQQYAQQQSQAVAGTPQQYAQPQAAPGTQQGQPPANLDLDSILKRLGA